MNNINNEKIDEKIKRIISEAVQHCWINLQADKNYLNVSDYIISRKSAIHGHEMFEFIQELRKKLIDKEKQKLKNNIVTKNTDAVEIKTVVVKLEKLNPDLTKNTSRMYNYSNETEDIKKVLRSRKKTKSPTGICSFNNGSLSSKIKRSYKLVSFADKKKVVNLSIKNPNWAIHELRKNSGIKIQSNRQLNDWKELVNKGLSYKENYMKIDQWVFKKCLEYKNKNKTFSNDLLITWAVKAKKIYFNENNTNVISWVRSFKKRHNIIGPNSRELQIDQETDKSSSIDSSSNSLDKKKNFINASTNKFHLIPSNEKLKVIKLANDNPTWSLNMLRAASGMKYLDYRAIHRWKRDYENGGVSLLEKRIQINNYIDNKITEYISKNKIITEKIIQNWLIEGKRKFKALVLNNTRCKTWWVNLLSKHNLTKYKHYKPSKIIYKNKKN